MSLDNDKVLKKIVLVDDHEIFRQGLKTLINSFDHFQIVASLNDGKQLESFLEKQVPDLVVMDIDMPYMDGITATRYIKNYFPDIKVIILSMYTDAYTIEKAFKAGASAYLTKNITKKIFSEAIAAVLENKNYISNDAAVNYSLSHFEGRDNRPLHFNSSQKLNGTSSVPDFTDREIDIAKLIVKGYSSKKIADIISLSPRTIETYRFKLMKKLKVKTSTELVRVLIEMNILD